MIWKKENVCLVRRENGWVAYDKMEKRSGCVRIYITMEIESWKVVVTNDNYILTECNIILKLKPCGILDYPITTSNNKRKGIWKRVRGSGMCRIWCNDAIKSHPMWPLSLPLTICVYFSFGTSIFFPVLFSASILYSFFVSHAQNHIYSVTIHATYFFEE